MKNYFIKYRWPLGTVFCLVFATTFCLSFLINRSVIVNAQDASGAIITDESLGSDSDQNSDLAQFSNTGQNSTACFEYYPFGKLKFNLDTDRGSYNNGDVVQINGSILNTHSIPVSDISVLAQLFIKGSANYPELLIDQKVLEKDIAIQPGSERKISLSFQLPAWLPKGDYALFFFMIESEQFNISGLPFIPNVPGAMEGFSVSSPLSMKLPFFLLDSSKINGNLYNRNLPAVPIDGDSVRAELFVFNPNNSEEIVSVKKSLYHWDNSSEKNLLKSETSSMRLGALSKSLIDFSASDIESGTYMIVFDAMLADGSKTQSRLRFGVPGERMRLIWSGITKFPVVAGESVELVSCFANETSNASFDNSSSNSNNLNVTGVSSDGQEVFSNSSKIDTSPTVGLVRSSHTMEKTGDQNISLNLEIVDPNNKKTSFQKQYAASMFQEQQKSFNTVVFEIVGVIVILLVVVIILYFLRRHKMNSRHFILLLFFIAGFFPSHIADAEVFNLKYVLGNADLRFAVNTTVDLRPVNTSPGFYFPLSEILSNQTAEWYVTGGYFDSPPFSFSAQAPSVGATHSITNTTPLITVLRQGGVLQEVARPPAPAADAPFDNFCFLQFYNGQTGGNKLCLLRSAADVILKTFGEDDSAVRLRWAGVNFSRVTSNSFNMNFGCNFQDKYYQVINGVDTELLFDRYSQSQGLFFYMSHPQYIGIGQDAPFGDYTIKIKRTFSGCNVSTTLGDGAPSGGAQSTQMLDGATVITGKTIEKSTTVRVGPPQLSCSTVASPTSNPSPWVSFYSFISAAHQNIGWGAEYAVTCSSNGNWSPWQTYSSSGSSGTNCQYTNQGSPTTIHNPRIKLKSTQFGTEYLCTPAIVTTLPPPPPAAPPAPACQSTAENATITDRQNITKVIAAGNPNGQPAFSFRFKCNIGDEWSAFVSNNSFNCSYIRTSENRTVTAQAAVQAQNGSVVCPAVSMSIPAAEPLPPPPPPPPPTTTPPPTTPSPTSSDPLNLTCVAEGERFRVNTPATVRVTVASDNGGGAPFEIRLDGSNDPFEIGSSPFTVGVSYTTIGDKILNIKVKEKNAVPPSAIREGTCDVPLRIVVEPNIIEI